jgi:hypothetical protein
MSACSRVTSHTHIPRINAGTWMVTVRHRLWVDHVHKKFILLNKVLIGSTFAEYEPDVLKIVFHNSSVMWKNNIENNGKTLDGKSECWKKLKHGNVLL